MQSTDIILETIDLLDLPLNITEIQPIRDILLNGQKFRKLSKCNSGGLDIYTTYFPQRGLLSRHPYDKFFTSIQSLPTCIFFKKAPLINLGSLHFGKIFTVIFFSYRIYWWYSPHICRCLTPTPKVQLMGVLGRGKMRVWLPHRPHSSGGTHRAFGKKVPFPLVGPSPVRLTLSQRAG